MDLDNIKKLIKENEQEIANLINELGLDKDHIDFSKLVKGNLSDRFVFLDEQTEKLKKFVKSYEESEKKIQDLETKKTDDYDTNKKIDKEIAKVKKAMKKSAQNLRMMSQGKTRNIFSCFIGQIDKRIHNAVYNKGTSWFNRSQSRVDTRWNNHVERVNKRYTWLGLAKYFGIRAAVFTAIAFIPGLKIGLGAWYGVLGLANGVYFGQAAIRTVATLYDKIRYGKPLLERTKRIFKGDLSSSLNEAIYQNRKSNLILSNENVISNVNTKSNPTINNSTTATVTSSKTNTKSIGSPVVDNSKLIIINKIDTFNLSNDKIEDYASLISIVRSKGLENDLPTVVLTGRTLSTKQKYDEIVSKYNALYEALKKKEEPVKKDEPVVIDTPKAVDKPVSSPRKEDVKRLSIDSTMTFSKAISIVRDNKVHSKEELESAMGKLASTFGNRNKRADAGDIKKALSDFNKTEKMLSEYGDKIKNGKADSEDKMIYQALLMHLAKYEKNEPFSINTLEDDIRDYFDDIADKAEEYDRRKNPSRYDSDGNFVGKGGK